MAEYKCSMCGKEFGEEEAGTGCKNCPMHSKGCNLIRCPNCGYEWPPEPKWLKKLFGNDKKT
ncbi:MAG: hypothetical protein WCI43_07895 [Candidatus Firestonebacteria bacterium]